MTDQSSSDDVSARAKKGRRTLKRARPPRDNPRQRAQELSETVVFAGERDGTDQPPTLAALGVSAPNYAQQRLQALTDAQEMGVLAALTPAARGISNWVQLGPIAIPGGQTFGTARVYVTGRVTSIVVHPSMPERLYLGTARGGVWRSHDAGRNWTPVSDDEVSLAIGALALAPSNPRILYAGTGEGNWQQYATDFPMGSAPINYLGSGVLKSMDGGDSWRLQGAAQLTGAAFYRIAVHPTNEEVVFAATSRGLYRTMDGGRAWQKLTHGLPPISSPVIAASDVAIDPANPDTVYAAFFGGGIFKTEDGSAAAPSWTKQADELPVSNLGRIALAISPSSTNTVYALVAKFDSTGGDVLEGLYVTDGAGKWIDTGLDVSGIPSFASYTMALAVDPLTPHILYIGGVSLHRAARDTATGHWSQSEIGSQIHPDTHDVVIDPNDHRVVYAGNDGGIYRSHDAGATWDDTINVGLCITQFESMDQHPTADAMCIGGTQDNGTEMFCNSPVFHHADDGDGGAVAIDPAHPANVLSTYYYDSPKRSTSAGRFGTWKDVSGGLAGRSIFYPPMALDRTNSNNAAFGTDRINLDPAQGTRRWPTKVTLPGIAGRVSAIDYVNSTLIYCATTGGHVFRLLKNGASWTSTALHDPALPGRWIWDIAALPDDDNTIVVVMSGFGTPHVWQGAVSTSGDTVWTDISGNDPGRLPDVPLNSMVIDPLDTDVIYVGTDIGVFRTVNGGRHWALFNDGLPNVAVYDMRLHEPTRLLRAATHGRGLWERKLDLSDLPDVHLFVRDHVAATGRVIPTPSPMPAPFDEPLQHVRLGDALWGHQCADIKVDALEGVVPSYQMNVADVDYISFETKLTHRNARPGSLNRVYVQVRNRGIVAAANVTVKLYYSAAAAGLPDLPADFWTVFPDESADLTQWKPVGAAQVIPTISPTEPAILEWDWEIPQDAAEHSCLLLVMDCPDDPIPEAGKVLNIARLVHDDRRVGLKNVHVVEAAVGTHYATRFHFHGEPGSKQTIRITESNAREWDVGLLFPRVAQPDLSMEGMEAVPATHEQLTAFGEALGDEVENYETDAVRMVTATQHGGAVHQVQIPAGGLNILLVLSPRKYATERSFTLLQEAAGGVAGGSTFVLCSIKSMAPRPAPRGPVF